MKVGSGDTTSGIHTKNSKKFGNIQRFALNTGNAYAWCEWVFRISFAPRNACQNHIRQVPPSTEARVFPGIKNAPPVQTKVGRNKNQRDLGRLEKNCLVPDRKCWEDFVFWKETGTRTNRWTSFVSFACGQVHAVHNVWILSLFQKDIERCLLCPKTNHSCFCFQERSTPQNQTGITCSSSCRCNFPHVYIYSGFRPGWVRKWHRQHMCPALWMPFCVQIFSIRNGVLCKHFQTFSISQVWFQCMYSASAKKNQTKMCLQCSVSVYVLAVLQKKPWIHYYRSSSFQGLKWAK